VAKFKKKPTTIEAIRITQVMVLKTTTGIARGRPGDWLITSKEGEGYFVNDRTFQDNYEPLDEYSKEYLKEVQERHKFGF